MTIRTTVLVAAVLTVPVAVSRLYQWRRGNSGSTPAERRLDLAGDDLIPMPDGMTTMAIHIDAPPEAVWPWIVQMGIDRAGFYTHLWVENGIFRLGARNADHVVPAWQDLQVGDRVWFTRNRRFGPLVMQMEPNHALVLCIGEDLDQALMTWQFVLQPTATGGTRLLLRTRPNPHRPLAVKVFDFLFEAGYSYMDIGMLRGIRERAERAAAMPGGAGIAIESALAA
jgi:uncharacterized protein YndB with AHSA1/START domain